MLLERPESDARKQGDEYAAEDILRLPHTAHPTPKDLRSGLGAALERA